LEKVCGQTWKKWIKFLHEVLLEQQNTKKQNPKGTRSAAPHRNLPLLAEELSAAQLPRTGARRGARPLSPVT
jgi:hypothetical protein